MTSNDVAFYHVILADRLHALWCRLLYRWSPSMQDQLAVAALETARRERKAREAATRA